MKFMEDKYTKTRETIKNMFIGCWTKKDRFVKGKVNKTLFSLKVKYSNQKLRIFWRLQLTCHKTYTNKKRTIKPLFCKK